MALNGKLISQITLKSNVNKFQDHLWFAPHQLSDISPQIIQSVELDAGKWGAAGSIMTWNFNQEGKKRVSKEVIEAVEDGEGKKVITYKAIDGDLLEVYKAFKLIIDAESIGEGTTVTFAIEYEKKTDSVAEPRAFLDVCVALIKDIDHHLSLVPN